MSPRCWWESKKTSLSVWLNKKSSCQFFRIKKWVRTHLQNTVPWLGDGSQGYKIVRRKIHIIRKSGEPVTTLLPPPPPAAGQWDTANPKERPSSCSLKPLPIIFARYNISPLIFGSLQSDLPHCYSPAFAVWSLLRTEGPNDELTGLGSILIFYIHREMVHGRRNQMKFGSLSLFD